MFETPLIPADQPMAVLAALFAIAGLAFLLEKTPWGKALTGAVWAILLAILLSNIGILPYSSPGYDVVFTYFVPILIPLFLIKANLRRIFFETTRMAGAFGLAALGTAAGAIIGASLLPLGEFEAEITGLFTATYIGGSVNYAALADITGLNEDASFMAAATAVDNLMSAAFLILLSLLPGITWIANRFVLRDHSGTEEDTVSLTSGVPTAMTLTIAAAYALAVVVLSDSGLNWLEAQINASGDAEGVTDLGSYRYLLITALALILPTAMPNLMDKLHGGFELGVGLAFVFFAAIAAGANIQAMIDLAQVILPFALILLGVHAVVVFGLGRFFGLSLPELITASNAAVLGATTAPALAAAKGWNDLITPGVLVGVLGYAAGTYIAVLVLNFWSLVGG